MAVHAAEEVKKRAGKKAKQWAKGRPPLHYKLREVAQAVPAPAAARDAADW